MSRPINWGFWGASTVAHLVAQDLRRVAGAKVSAVASRSAVRARAFALAHSIPRVHADLQAMLSDREIDVVYVSTPNNLHADDTIACLRAGKAVLCEKPFAMNEGQAASMIAEARAAGRFCMEAMWMRFIPAVKAATDVARDGAIGRVKVIAGDFAYTAQLEPSGRLFARELGGGALLDRGAYLISLAQAILGEPDTVQASAHFAATGVDAISSYQMQYAGGATAQLWAGLSVRGTNSVTIVGEQGQIRLHEPFYAAHRISVTHDAPPRALSKGGVDSSVGFAARLKRVLAQQGLNRRVDWLRSARLHVRSTSMPFPGNGYQFELAEVSRCLSAGLDESTVMPLHDSQAVARTMDRIRACWRPPSAPPAPDEQPFNCNLAAST